MNEIILQTKGLSKRYGDRIAVKDLSLDVRRGEVFGFLGPNGAGKTTSISMICGLLRPDAGQVLLDGELVAAGGSRIRARIGVCPQEIVLWKGLTCLEQLQFVGEMYGLPGREARRRGATLLEALGLADRGDQLARGLSGGMQRRLNLALALVHDPELVVLDEPAAGLDPQSRVLVREFVRSLARRRTVILTTHDMDEAERLSDRVGILDGGFLVALDTPAALKRGVGEGDVLEIDLNGMGAGRETNLDCARAALQGLEGLSRLETIGETVRLHAADVVRLLPAAHAVLQSAGLQPGEVRLRRNTLEDVFIRLTGRRLRE